MKSFIACISVVVLELLSHGVKGATISDNFGILDLLLNYTLADQECKRRGFDGLGVLNSPTDYNYIVRATEGSGKIWGHWVALRYELDFEKFIWQDGSEPASDTPWDDRYIDDSYISAGHVCGMMRTSGLFGMLRCRYQRYAICGYRIKKFSETPGTIIHSALPSSKEGILSQSKMESHPQCALLCGMLPTCRLASLDSVTLTCTLYGPGEYRLAESFGAKTFVREDYINKASTTTQIDTVNKLNDIQILSTTKST